MPVVVRRLFVPVWDVYVLATTVVVVSLVDTGPPRTKPRRGVGRSGRESAMTKGGFFRNVFGPPKWECEARGSVVWVKCATSAECI